MINPIPDRLAAVAHRQPMLRHRIPSREPSPKLPLRDPPTPGDEGWQDALDDRKVLASHARRLVLRTFSGSISRKEIVPVNVSKLHWYPRYGKNHKIGTVEFDWANDRRTVKDCLLLGFAIAHGFSVKGF